MSMKLSFLRRCAAVATVGVAFLHGHAQALEKLTLAQNQSPISGVSIVAKQQGLFEKHGLDVTVANFTSGKQCLDTVIGGGADIATTAEAPTTAAAMAKQPIAFLARTEYSDLKTLTAASAGIVKLADLKGKRIAYTAGTGGDVYTQALLKKAGLSAADVSLINLRPQDMVNGMASGSIDAYNSWEPHITNGRKALAAKVSELDTRGIYAETFNIVVMQDYLAKHRPVVDAFLAALIEADTWMQAHREESITVVANFVGMKREDLAAVWDNFHYEVVLDERSINVLQQHAAWRLSSGNAPTGAVMPDFSKVIVAEPLKKLAPSRVKLGGL
jgi:ABC-type nitrate/sulfonate/bicarbonate transport system substrate-binding protein